MNAQATPQRRRNIPNHTTPTRNAWIAATGQPTLARTPLTIMCLRSPLSLALDVGGHRCGGPIVGARGHGQ